MRSTIRCFYQCPDRVLHCHETCEKYKAEKEEYLKAKSEVKKQHNKDKAITNAMVENKRRVRKAAHIKK